MQAHNYSLKISIVKDIIKYLYGSWPGRLVLAAILLPLVLDGIKIYKEFDGFSLAEGIVIDKQYQPAQAQRVANPAPGTSGDITIEHPEKWILIIEGHDRTGERKQREIVVS